MESTDEPIKASPQAIAALRAAYPSLPEEYFSFLAMSNGAEGDLGIEPGWVQLYSAEDALTATHDCGVADELPGYFAFGSNGGGEIFLMPLDRAAGNCPVEMVDACSLARKDIRPVCASFADFQEQIGVPMDDEE